MAQVQPRRFGKSRSSAQTSVPTASQEKELANLRKIRYRGQCDKLKVTEDDLDLLLEQLFVVSQGHVDQQLFLRLYFGIRNCRCEHEASIRAQYSRNGGMYAEAKKSVFEELKKFRVRRFGLIPE